MPVRVTLHPGEDVELPDGARLGDLRASLADLARRPELLHTPLRADDAALDDDSVVGARPLLPGAVLRTAPRGSPSDATAPGATTAPEVTALRSPWLLSATTGPDAGEPVPLMPAAPVRLGPVTVAVDARGRVRLRPGRVRVPRRGSRVGTARAGTRRRPGRRRAEHRPTLVTRRVDRERRRRLRMPRRWRPATVLEVGGTRYTLHRSGDVATWLAPCAPEAPARSLPGWGMLATGLVPVVGSVALAVAFRQPLYALFSLVAVVALLPQVLAARRRRTGSAAVPDPQNAASAPSPSREAGTDPVRMAMRVVAAHEASDGAWRQALESLATRARHRTGALPPSDRPADLLPDGAVAVCGPAGAARAIARAVVVDLAAAGASVSVCGTGRERWSWCRWLDGAAGSDGGGSTPVLVVDGVDPAARAAADAAARRGDAVVLCLPEPGPGARRPRVPSWCRTVLTVGPDGRCRRSAPDGTGTVEAPVGVSVAYAERTARRLAGLRALDRRLTTLTDAARGAEVPSVAPSDRSDPTDPRLSRTVPLGDLVVTGDPTSRWRTATGWAVPVGRDAGGDPVLLDLVADGPHLLVAGTTGAGKSELLQSLVLALALTRSPADLAFALVDFKGGASFGRCADLPHVVGQVTDLEPGLAGRALAGLRAELRRREQVLADHGVAALDDAPPGTLTRLVVVIDEFRALADDLPEFLPGLLRVAAQGRSLGVHLVLATQRPAGAVGSDVRANVSTRIALRVVDASDSHDVVDASAAARIPADAPGRAVLRRGSAAPVVVQAAHAGSAPDGGTPVARRAPVWRSHAEAGGAGGSAGGSAGGRAGGSTDGRAGGPAEPAGGRAGGSTDGRAGGPAEPAGGPDQPAPGPHRAAAARTDHDPVAAVVDDVQRAAHAIGHRPGRPPWLPPLPTEVRLRTLPSDVDRGAPCDGLPVALGEQPSRQRRLLVRWHPSAGHLAVLGGARSGRTTALVQLATAALDAGWHVHALVAAHAADRFAAMGDHPRFGTLTGPEDPRRARRLLSLLSAPPGGGAGATPGPDGGAGAASQGDPAAPPRLVVVDDVAELRAALAGPDLWDPLTTALTENRTAFALGADSPTVGGVAARTGPRLVLLSGDQHADVMLGAPSAVAGSGGTPGRGVWLTAGDPPTCQVLLPDAPSTHEVPTGEAPAEPPPVRVRPLPPRVGLADLTPADGVEGPDSHAGPDSAARRDDLAGPDSPAGAAAPDGPGGPLVPVGIGGDAAGAVCLDVRDGALVVGPRASGRTTVLRTVTRWASARGRLLAVVGRDAALRADAAQHRRAAQHSATGPDCAAGPDRAAGPDVTLCAPSPHDVRGLLDRLERDPGAVTSADPVASAPPLVIVDDLDALAQSCPVEADRLGALVLDGAVSLVASATTQGALMAHRGALAELRGRRTGVVLAPGDRGADEVFGVALAAAADPGPPRPGRGALVRRGRAVPVQAAVP